MALEAVKLLAAGGLPRMGSHMDAVFSMTRAWLLRGAGRLSHYYPLGGSSASGEAGGSGAGSGGASAPPPPADNSSGATAASPLAPPRAPSPLLPSIPSSSASASASSSASTAPSPAAFSQPLCAAALRAALALCIASSAWESHVLARVSASPPALPHAAVLARWARLTELLNELVDALGCVWIRVAAQESEAHASPLCPSRHIKHLLLKACAWAVPAVALAIPTSARHAAAGAQDAMSAAHFWACLTGVSEGAAGGLGVARILLPSSASWHRGAGTAGVVLGLLGDAPLHLEQGLLWSLWEACGDRAGVYRGCRGGCSVSRVLAAVTATGVGRALGGEGPFSHCGGTGATPVGGGEQGWGAPSCAAGLAASAAAAAAATPGTMQLPSTLTLLLRAGASRAAAAAPGVRASPPLASIAAARFLTATCSVLSALHDQPPHSALLTGLVAALWLPAPPTCALAGAAAAGCEAYLQRLGRAPGPLLPASAAVKRLASHRTPRGSGARFLPSYVGAASPARALVLPPLGPGLVVGTHEYALALRSPTSRVNASTGALHARVAGAAAWVLGWQARGRGRGKGGEGGEGRGSVEGGSSGARVGGGEAAREPLSVGKGPPLLPPLPFPPPTPLRILLPPPGVLLAWQGTLGAGAGAGAGAEATCRVRAARDANAYVRDFFAF